MHPEHVAVITPVFLVQHPVSGKWRLIHDLRAMNVRMVEMVCKYDRVFDALNHNGSFAMKVDILSAFRHVAVHEEDERFMGFSINGWCFVWKALPFGSSQSPAVFVNALNTVIGQLRLAGVRMVVYVDDILIIAEDVPSLVASMAKTLQALRASGWYIALEKAYLYPMSKVPFLGMVVDFTAKAAKVSIAKSNRIAALALDMSRRRVVSFVLLAKLGGILAFCAQIAPLCRLARLGINAASAEAASRHSGAVAVKGALLEDLRFWAKHGGKLHEYQTVSRDFGLVLVTDAAGPPAWGWGAVGWRADTPAPDVEELLSKPKPEWLDSEGILVTAGEIDHRRPNPSSAAWELEALVKALLRIIKKDVSIIRGKLVRWFSDSSAATSIVKGWRTKSSGVSLWLRKLFNMCRKHSFDVDPVWVSREAGWQPIADWLSRLSWRRKTAEYCFSEEDRMAVMALVGASPRDFDAFASPLEEKMVSSVATRWPCPGALTDGFSVSWEGRRVWAFPPFQDVARVFAKIMRTAAVDAVVIFPTEVPLPAELLSRLKVPVVSIPQSKLHRVGGGAMKGHCPHPVVGCVC